MPCLSWCCLRAGGRRNGLRGRPIAISNPAPATEGDRHPAIITISDQPGAGANEIGLRVATLLGTDHFDRLILERVALHLKATMDAVEGLAWRVLTRIERVQRFLERAFERGAYSGWAADRLVVDVVDRAAETFMIG
ncbi:MAG: cytidylate kinase-like family protein [SAR202 cluster bacterium]|nr:cytidylate kinase-like family protein [SAR202 cluster bacterium]